jgi:hypothetical protein
MELNDNQFLKIKVLHKNWIDFEIFEIPTERGKRPKRWHLQIPYSHLVNRHKRESKIMFIHESLARVKMSFFSEYYPAATAARLNELFDQVLESEFQR